VLCLLTQVSSEVLLQKAA